MTGYRAGQRVRIEWSDGSAVEGLAVKHPWHRWSVEVNGSVHLLNSDDGRTVTVLAEPRPEEPTGLGAVVEARAGARTQRRRWIHVGKGDWLSVMEDAREPGGFWTVRERWSDLIDPVVLSEGWTP